MAQICFCVDDDVKHGAEYGLNDVGLSMFAVINLFLRKFTSEKRIPFELSSDSFYSKSYIRHLENIMLDVKDREGIGKLEPLKNFLSGWLSRWIDETNRIVSY